MLARQTALTLCVSLVITVVLIFNPSMATERSISSQAGILSIRASNFEPAFIVAGRQTTVKVSVEIADSTLHLAGSKLILERQKPLLNGHIVFIPIAELYDDPNHRGRCNAVGKQGVDCQHNFPHYTKNDHDDNIPYDGIFTGVAKFDADVSGAIYLRVRGIETTLHQTLISSEFSLPVQLACGPTGNILPINVISGNGDKMQSQLLEFQVPDSGKAVLRLVNGARIGASTQERINNASITVNGRRVTTLRKNDNVLELPVLLQQGGNQLEIKLGMAKSSERFSARIDTCATDLTLEPIIDTQRIGSALTAKAALTGLGFPIPNAPLEFSLVGLGDFPTQTTSTNDAGMVTVTMQPFELPGTGKLKVATSSVEPKLHDISEVSVVANPSIAVYSGLSSLTLKAGETKPLIIFSDLLKADSQSYEATLEQQIESNGISLTPTGKQTIVFEAPASGQTVSRRIKQIPFTLTGLNAGNYTLTSRATLKQTGETISTELDVKVLPAQENLKINQPTIQPGAIPIDKSAIVIFQTQVTGVKQRPGLLTVQECNPKLGGCSNTPGDYGWQTLGDLLDNGVGSDTFKDDGVYSGGFFVTGDEEGQLLYRVIGRSNLSLSPSLSPVTALTISRFSNGSELTQLDIIDLPDKNIPILADQVLASFLPSVSADRIQQIITASTVAATGQAGKGVRYLPEIGVVQIELADSVSLNNVDRVSLIEATISQLKTFDEVRYAEPTLIMTPATTIPDGGVVNQWGIVKTNTDRAWDAVTANSPGNKALISIVDTGVLKTHNDLIDQLTSDSQNGDINTTKFPNGHGTGVAAIIGAKHDGSGISGLAYGSTIHSVNGLGTGNQFDYTYQSPTYFALDGAVKKDEVKIINLSWDNVSIEPKSFLKLIQTATEEKNKLVVVSAGNLGRNVRKNSQGPLQDTTQNPPVYDELWYPCSWDEVLCVGSSDQSDAISSFSNYGRAVSLYSPGISIYTASAKGIDKYFVGDGTSYSAPYVSAAAAILYAEAPENWDAKKIKKRLTSSAENIASSNFLNAGGRMNVFSALVSESMLSGKAWLTTTDPGATGDWTQANYDDSNWKVSADNASQGSNTPQRVCSVISQTGSCDSKDVNGLCVVSPSSTVCNSTRARFMWHPDNPAQAYFRLKFWIKDCSNLGSYHLHANVIADDYFELWVNGIYQGNRLLDEYKSNQTANPGIPRPFDILSLQCGENIVAIRANDGYCQLNSNNRCPDPPPGDVHQYYGNSQSRGNRAVFFDGNISLPN